MRLECNYAHFCLYIFQSHTHTQTHMAVSAACGDNEAQSHGAGCWILLWSAAVQLWTEL